MLQEHHGHFNDRRFTVSIWVDMMTMNDSRGKVAAYWPEVHWSIDERDTVKPEALNELCEKLRREIELALALP